MGVALLNRRFSLIDDLFERDFISFACNGKSLISPVARGDDMKKMGVRTDGVMKSAGLPNGKETFLNSTAVMPETLSEISSSPREPVTFACDLNSNSKSNL